MIYIWTLIIKLIVMLFAEWQCAAEMIVGINQILTKEQENGDHLNVICLKELLKVCCNSSKMRSNLILWFGQETQLLIIYISIQKKKLSQNL